MIIRSEIVIPELQTADGNHDIDIILGDVPVDLVNPSEKNECFQATKDEFLFKLPDIASFYVKDGKNIVIQSLCEDNQRDIRLFLLGSVFGALLHQRGYLVLHGSCVEVDGQGVIFTGQSRAGKSTLAAAFHDKGYRVLTDDVIAIEIKDDGKSYIIPGFPNIKLWQDAADKLNKTTTGLEPIRNEITKYRVAAEEKFLDEPLALCRVYILSPFEDPNFSITKLASFDKVKALIQNTYRLGFLKGQGVSGLHLKQCATVSKTAEISVVNRPRTGFLLDELVQFILADILKS